MRELLTLVDWNIDDVRFLIAAWPRLPKLGVKILRPGRLLFDNADPIAGFPRGLSPPASLALISRFRAGPQPNPSPSVEWPQGADGEAFDAPCTSTSPRVKAGGGTRESCRFREDNKNPAIDLRA